MWIGASSLAKCRDCTSILWMYIPINTHSIYIYIVAMTRLQRRKIRFGREEGSKKEVAIGVGQSDCLRSFILSRLFLSSVRFGRNLSFKYNNGINI